MLPLIITALILLLALWTWRNWNLPPGPWGVPVLGYLPWLDPKAPYLTLASLSEKYGPVFGLSLGNVYTVVLTDPKVIRTVFSLDSTTGRAPLYLTHGIMGGYGLICAEGDLWKDQRKFVHNCLRQLGGTKIGQQRNKMEALIKAQVVDFLQTLEKTANSKPIDPLKQLRHSLGSAVNLIVFGKAWSREDETWKWLQHLQEEGTRHIGVAGPLNFLSFLRFLPKYKETMHFLLDGKHKTHQLYQKIIDDQAKLLEKEDSLNENNENPDNIIQAFLLERKRRSPETIDKFYNDQQFYHLLADIFGAGLDTTLTTLRWYFLYVARNPKLQNDIRNEMSEVLQGRPPSLEDMPHLPLVEASICEAQRIRSVVPVGIPHGSLEEISIAGYHIPKGTMIIPLQWALHMDNSIWQEPEVFNPSRFIDDDGKVLKVDHFMPFQVGKRMCVGDELARMLLFLFASTTLFYFQLSLDDEEEINFSGDCGITLTPKPHKIVFQRTSNIL